MYDRTNDMPTPAILKQLTEMMRTIHFKRLSILISTVSLLGLLCASILQESGHNATSTSEADVAGKLTFQNERRQRPSASAIHVVSVVCADRLEQSFVMMKSAIMLSKAQLVFHIFADKEFKPEFKNTFDNMSVEYQKKFVYNVYDVVFPNTTVMDSSHWRVLARRKPCTTERLFLHDLLPEVDAVIYLDTDIVLFSPLDELWNHFSHFNSSQLIAAIPAREHANELDKKRQIPIPFVVGINAGVLLMNLTRIRAANFLTSIDNLFTKYYKVMWYADQDLINMYIYFHPHQFYLLSCEWNYCTDHCMFGEESECKAAAKSRIHLLHGTRLVFQYTSTQKLFRAVFQVFLKHTWSSSNVVDLLRSLKQRLEEMNPNTCEKLKLILLRQIQLDLKRLT